MYGNYIGRNEKRTSTERGENGGCGFGERKERSYRGEETEANRPNAVSRFCTTAFGATTGSRRHCCECSRCYCRGTSSSFGATATTGCRRFSRGVRFSFGNRYFCWKYKLSASSTNANGSSCKRSHGVSSLPWSNAICFWRRKLWTKSRRNPVFGKPFRRFSSRHELRRATSVTLWTIATDFANAELVHATTARSCGESSRGRSASSRVR